MIKYPMILPGGHPAVEGILGEEVYVEVLHEGPTVGFAAFGKGLWVDMPVEHIQLLNDKEFNPAYHYIGILLSDPDRIVLTDIMTRNGPLDHEAKFVEADRLRLECVQLLHAGGLESGEQLQGFLQQAPHGITIKPIKTYAQERLIYAEITSDMFVSQGDDSCQTPSLES